MGKILSVYLENSVVGGYFEKIWRAHKEAFWRI